MSLFPAVSFAKNDKVKDFLLSVVVPVYNEFETINTIVDAIQAVDINKELILVDDFSRDGTREKLIEIEKAFVNVKVFYHTINRGKGAALRTGFKHVSGDIVVIQDADLEYNPNEYYKLVYPIITGHADVVYGSRFIGETHRVLFFWHSVANKLLTLMSNMFTDLNLTDMETCYKVFRKSVIDGIEIKSNRFGFEPEFTAKVAKQKWRIYEVPIQYYGRDYSEGKKIGWRDGLNAIWCVLRFNLFK
ncbi:MAG: glycosyltransferase family 2 protein [candidate division KSB1 bacterium]|nr:glycosyltransferase family 2 protein [candidate division KSB1 bacterium]